MGLPTCRFEPRHRLAVDRAFEARAHHQVVAGSEALDERREVRHRVGLVGVSHDDVLAPGDREPREVRAAVAGPFLAHDGRAVVCGDLGGAVGRGVVDDDHLAQPS